MLRRVVAGRLMKDLTSDRNAVAAETAQFLIPVRCPRMAFREADFMLRRNCATAVVKPHTGRRFEIGVRKPAAARAVSRCGRTACPVSTRGRRLRVRQPLMTRG